MARRQTTAGAAHRVTANAPMHTPNTTAIAGAVKHKYRGVYTG